MNKEGGKMPSKREYDLVSDDGYDTRIPLHNEDAFQHGIPFQAKYIGTLDVPRPSSRVEIVASMRRIRYEFKAKAIKKRKVSIEISVDGVKVSMCKKKKKTPDWYDENKLVIVHHPIYRIFYVSHDSQDLKIWSYIARDGPSNVFKCNVFKSYKKEQAMRIVRSIGQAFEVCHKLTLGHPIPPVPEEGPESEGGHSQAGDTDRASSKSKEVEDNDSTKRHSSTVSSKGRATPPNELALRQAKQLLYQMAVNTPAMGGTTITSIHSPALLGEEFPDTELPITAHHHAHLLRQQLEQQQQHTQVAIAQVHLLKDQLAAETAARIESQTRAHQLLLQNRDLLEHMNQMLARLQELEMRAGDDRDTIREPAKALPLPKFALPDPTTPQCGPVLIASPGQGHIGPYLTATDLAVGQKDSLDTDSPDSGHREMSSDSLALTLAPGDVHFWEQQHHDDGVKYSFGYSSPVKFTSTSYELTAIVNSNPFVTGGDNFVNKCVDEFTCFDGNVSSVGHPALHCSENGDSSKRELKLDTAPRLKPPPEFRNSQSNRHSKVSDSSSSTNSDTDSVKDGIVNFTDSDYYSHTGSSTKTNTCATGDHLQFTDNRDLPKPVTTYKPNIEYHFNNFTDEPSALQKYFDEEAESNCAESNRQSFSSDELVECIDDDLPLPPSPPPPPRHLEVRSQDKYDQFPVLKISNGFGP